MADKFSALQTQHLKEICEYLREFIDAQYPEQYQELRDLFYYHLGLNDPIDKQGKRIRPILTLLCASGLGVPAARAMPAAAAIELVHNFSLIHDDIEDNGVTRRGKAAVWKKWGLAQGLNAGDGMFNAAFLSLQKLEKEYYPEGMIDASRLLAETCHYLTMGQYLDIKFETEDQVSIEKYFTMIEGKTAALLACSTEMGALLGGADPVQRALYHGFGKHLGIAFQIFDDWLGIWGDEEKTGKSAIGDLLEKKKTYPILLGLQSSEYFQSHFRAELMAPETAQKLAKHLSEIGVEEQVAETCGEWTQKALDCLEQMQCEDPAKDHLRIITNKLLMRSR